MEMTPIHPGWRIQLAIHRAVRRDFRRLSSALESGSRITLADVRAYWAVTRAQLHDHHVFEDTIVWPLMAERLGERVALLLARNEREHEAMATTMEEFHTAVSASWTHEDVVRGRLHHLEDVALGHLADEEADVLPLIPEAFTLEDLAYFQAESAKTNPAPAFLPWVLDDASDEDVEFLTGRLPDNVRTQLLTQWLPGRQELVDAIVSGTRVGVSAR